MIVLTGPTSYHRWAKICWAKNSRFQPYEDFCGNTLAVPWPAVTIAKYSRENFHGTLTNRENHESLTHQIFPVYSISFMKLCMCLD